MLRVRVKPVDVPLKLRAHYVTTHSANLTWNPPIRLNPQQYKVGHSSGSTLSSTRWANYQAQPSVVQDGPPIRLNIQHYMVGTHQDQQHMVGTRQDQ